MMFSVILERFLEAESELTDYERKVRASYASFFWNRSEIYCKRERMKRGRKQMRTRMKVAAGATAFAILVIVVIMVSFPTILQPRTSTNPSDGTSIITKPLTELLPTSQDVSSDWISRSMDNVTVNATGFLEGIGGEAFTRGGSSPSGVTITIYRFNSSDAAGEYYNETVQNVSSAGGYNEVSTAGLGIESYGTDRYLPILIGLGYYERTTIYGVNLNIYFTVEVSSSVTSTQGDAIQFAKAIADKL